MTPMLTAAPREIHFTNPAQSSLPGQREELGHARSTPRPIASSHREESLLGLCLLLVL